MTQSTHLEATLAKLPDRPGVYLMKDAGGEVVYVGKAQSLRSRVRSYWQREAPGQEPHRIRQSREMFARALRTGVRIACGRPRWRAIPSRMRVNACPPIARSDTIATASCVASSTTVST